MKHLSIGLILLGIFCTIGKAEQVESKDSMITHPEKYIKVTDWSFFIEFVPVIHHVVIENTSDIAYKNVRIMVNYYTSDYQFAGILLSRDRAILPIILPPLSKGTYLEEGIVLGVVPSNFYIGSIEILGAIPVIAEGDKKSSLPSTLRQNISPAYCLIMCIH